MARLRTAARVAVVVAFVACGGGRVADIETAIAEIEAGRGTTPLVVQPSPGADAEVTFLVESGDGRAPRIVSDVTGWGESPDDSSFDLTIGTMARVGSSDWYRLDAQVAPRSRSDWYRLDAQVAPRSRIEYLVVYGETDYQVDPNNPRRAWSRGGDDISELVTPDYLRPEELSEAPVELGGTTVEGVIAISYGAKDALDAAVAPSRAYGRLGLLIPGRRLTPGDLKTFAEQRDSPLQVAILAGRYDQANLATAQQARQALTGAGHEVDHLEVPEGHNPSTWRNHLCDVLVSLFGMEPLDS